MSKFIIEGGHSLEGEIFASGAKNAALKMVAAAILTDEDIKLTNVPDIKDIQTIKTILEKMGAHIEFADHTMNINCSNIKTYEPDYQLVKHMRGSVVIIGPLLGRFGQTKIPQPGGCLIGSRPIDTHIDAFKQLNCRRAGRSDAANTVCPEKISGT